MREILFRAYDKTMKRYKPFDGEHDTMLISRDGKVDYYNLQNGSGFNEYILEQFTGLYDATKWEDLTDAERDEWIKAGHTKEDWKGRRIFEGDVLRIEDEDGYDYITEVWYERGGLVIDVKGFDYDYTVIGWVNYYSMEVIGNIHDNQELLEA